MVSVHTSSPPTVHTAYTSGVSVTVLSAILRVWVWILETQVGLSLVWKSTWKEKEDTANIALSLNASTCFVLSLGRHRRAKRKHRWHCTCFREVPSLPRLQTTGSGSRKSPQAFSHEHQSEIFLREEVLDASDRGLLRTRKFDQSAWRMANNQRFPSSLDHGKLWEKSKGLALPRLEQRGTSQWSLNDIPKQKKNKSSNEKHTHRSRFSSTMPRTSFPGHNCANGLFWGPR